MKKCLNLINGKWLPGSTGEILTTANPADTRELVAEYPRSNREDAQAAIESARRAATAWSRMTAVARGRILSKASQIIEGRKSQLAEALSREEGKTLGESQGEVQRAADIFRFFGGLSYTIGGRTLPHDLPGNLLFTLRQPLGVVAMITPWNFPIAIPAWKMAPALVSGNTVVIKPASLAPGPALDLAQALVEAGLPDGALNVVVGDGSTVGDELACNPAVAALSFTGSRLVGQQVYRQLAQRMARPQLEMGSKNPTIVLADADLDLASALVAKSGFGLTGQACTATSRVIVERPVLAEFTERLVARAQGLKVGPGMEPGIEMGPAVSQAQLEGNLNYVQMALAEGAKLLFGGRRLREGRHGHGWFMEPAVLGSVDPSMRIAREEVFGPVVGIIGVDSFEEALAVANGVDVGLSASLVTRDLKKAMVYAERIEVGVVKINQISTGLALQAPFGGVKKSSTDSFREQGIEAIDFYTRLKTIYVDYSV